MKRVPKLTIARRLRLIRTFPIPTSQATSLGINALELMLPLTLCCSYAFMLPVASPPNAIIFEAGDMKTKDMVSARGSFAMLRNVLGDVPRPEAHKTAADRRIRANFVLRDVVSLAKALFSLSVEATDGDVELF